MSKVIQDKIVVSDCNHISFEEEEEVARKNGVTFERHDLLLAKEEQIVAELGEYSVIGCQRLPVTGELLDKLPKLQCIVRYGVGVDNIDREAASARGVAVCNVPDYGTREVASHAFAMMMALTRKLKMTDRSLEKGGWDYSVSVPIYRYSEMTVGVVGYGRIGSVFGELAHALGAHVIATDPKFPPSISAEDRKAAGLCDWVEFTNLEDLLKRSHVVSLHAPLTETTKYLISYPQLKRMRTDAFLINCARGGMVNEADLYRALEEKLIQGAGIDTWEKEPSDKENPLLGLDNVLATPHMAWYSEQASSDLKRKLAEECIRFMKGEELKYRLN